MTTIKALYQRIIWAMAVEGLTIPTAAIKFYSHKEQIPEEVYYHHPSEITLTSCQAKKQASLGDAVLLTSENIGCVAAAITFGLVDMHRDKPLAGSRVYTDLMKNRSHNDDRFVPPSPEEFTNGTVYACASEKRYDFCLFGKDDSGRYRDAETARKAIADMIAIQPPTTKGVFFYSTDFDSMDLIPDVVVMTVRPVELTRIIQAYQYNTGKRVTASMGGLRVVNSDLIVRPYLTGEINISTYCLGARLIAQYEADKLGIGVPFKDFEIIAKGMEESATGFPFHLYPGT